MEDGSIRDNLVLRRRYLLDADGECDKGGGLQLNKSLSRCLSSAKRRFLKIMQEKDKRVLGFFFFFFPFKSAIQGKKG